MSEIPKQTPSTRDQLKTVMGGMASMATALGEQMAKDEVSRGLHTTKLLKAPVTDGFGTFTKKWEYTHGCEPLPQLTDSGAGEVRVSLMDPNGKRKLISIGKTPPEWHPGLGGKTIGDAGQPGDYLMVVADIDDAHTTIEGSRFRYLDEADIAGVRFVNGQDFTLGENTARQRQVTSPGTVEATSALVE